MRKLNTNLKIKADIPQELRDAFREVLHLIEESDRDPDYSIDFGDAIQVLGGELAMRNDPSSLFATLALEVVDYIMHYGFGDTGIDPPYTSDWILADGKLRHIQSRNRCRDTW